MRSIESPDVPGNKDGVNVRSLLLVLHEFFKGGGRERQSWTLENAPDSADVWGRHEMAGLVSTCCPAGVDAQQFFRLGELFPDTLPVVDMERYAYEVSVCEVPGIRADGYVLMRRSEVDGTDLAVFAPLLPMALLWSDLFQEDGPDCYDARMVPRTMWAALAGAYGVHDGAEEGAEVGWFYEVYPYLHRHRNYYLERWRVDIGEAPEADAGLLGHEVR